MRKKWKCTAAIMLAAAVFCTSVPVSAAQDAGAVEAEENTDGDSGDTNEGTIEETPSAEECDLSYRVHVQTYGWQDWKTDGGQPEQTENPNVWKRSRSIWKISRMKVALNIVSMCRHMAGRIGKQTARRPEQAENPNVWRRFRFV